MTSMIECRRGHWCIPAAQVPFLLAMDFISYVSERHYDRAGGQS